jgi:four helix bundle protein
MKTHPGRTDLKARTKAFALQVIELYSALPNTTKAQVLGRQVLRSGPSVGAHYREAFRSRSDAEFISTIEGGLHELNETSYWLELLGESRTAPADHLRPLLDEADVPTAIPVATVRSIKQRNGR